MSAGVTVDPNLNGFYVQVFQNGTTVQTPCGVNNTAVPLPLISSITKVDDSALCGPEIDHYVLLGTTVIRAYTIEDDVVTVKIG